MSVYFITPCYAENKDQAAINLNNVLYIIKEKRDITNTNIEFYIRLKFVETSTLWKYKNEKLRDQEFEWISNTRVERPILK